jgi:hypothetical protein
VTGPATIAAVVPSRNRPDLAIRAVRSLLDQDVELDIFVSDNSDVPDRKLAACAALPRVTYLRPPRVLAMPDHWEWALGQAMARSAAGHFTIHYDRKLSKPGRWGALAAIAGRRPDALITYPTDFVGADPPPLRLWQTPWTGKVFEIRPARIADLLASGCVTEIANALPILSNCIVPRPVLAAVAARFGNICSSTGPDSAFLARFLTMGVAQLHHDRPPSITYAPHRSAGLGYLRGRGSDFADFLDRFDDPDWLGASPVPGLNLGQNMLFHEYELVRRATGALPPLDLEAILDDLGRDLRWIRDPKLKQLMAARLRDHGWTGEVPGDPGRRPWSAVRFEWDQKLRMACRGQVPPAISGFSFRSDRAALRAGLRYPRHPQETHEHLGLLEPEEVAL